MAPCLAASLTPTGRQTEGVDAFGGGDELSSPTAWRAIRSLIDNRVNRAESTASPDTLDIGYIYLQVSDKKMIRADAARENRLQESSSSRP